MFLLLILSKISRSFFLIISDLEQVFYVALMLSSFLGVSFDDLGRSVATGLVIRGHDLEIHWRNVLKPLEFYKIAGKRWYMLTLKVLLVPLCSEWSLSQLPFTCPQNLVTHFMPLIFFYSLQKIS